MLRLATWLVIPALSVFAGLSFAETSSVRAGIATEAAMTKPPKLLPFTATYAAKFSGFGVTAKRELSASGGGWRLDFNVVSTFANIREYTRFTAKNAKLTPLHYEYHRAGLGKDRDTVLNFEYAERRVVNVGSRQDSLNDVPVDVQDKLSYQLQLGLDIAAGQKSFRYAVADGKKIRDYEFRLVGNEQVQTPIGLVDAVKVERVQSNKERVTHIWFAPRWNYALVKLSQRQGDGKNYQIILTKLSINGARVTAAN